MHNLIVSKWLVALAVPLLSASIRAGDQSWQKLNAMPEPNGGFIGLALPDAIIVVGGTNWGDGEKHWLRTVHRLDLVSLNWSSLTPLGPPRAYGVGEVEAAGLIIVGGSTGRAISPAVPCLEHPDGRLPGFGGLSGPGVWFGGRGQRSE